MAAKPAKECCLCGDIGFSKDLILCPICGFRLQHTYCSRSYPGIDMATWRCEWCVYDQEKREAGSKSSKPSELALDAVVQSPNTAPDGGEATEDTYASEEIKKARRKRDDDRRQTPNAGISPKSKRHKSGSDRWRKLNCNSPSTRVIGRRYKLLADVLC
ncbi:PHD finger-containing protein 1-like [Aristolochia californica]|uniref:PHD finger-containing protein 1-like n=1 Tax=Aristolochia californica TaxID=171875 RepID=UPI0035D6A3A0